MTFVNYTEGDEHKRVCSNCLETFDQRESQREDYCSMYCERYYETHGGRRGGQAQ